MKSDTDRFGIDRTAVNDNYDTDLVLSLIATYARYTAGSEDHLMAGDFMRLMRLLRANPARLVADYDEFREIAESEPRVPRNRSINWNPNARYGTRLALSPRNPVVRMLRTHYPPDHRVWNYIIVKTMRYR